MSSRLQRLAVLPFLAVLVLSLASCGGDTPPDQAEGLDLDDATLAAQLFTAMAATDSGGWLTEVYGAFNGTPRYAAALARSGRASILSRDTSFTRGFMNWTQQFTYYDSSGAAFNAWDSTIVRVRAHNSASGRIPLPGGGGASQNYVHVDTLDMDQLREDFIGIGGFTVVDSAFFTVGTTPDYNLMDNVEDYALAIRKNPASAYPDSGEAQIDGFIQELNTPVRTDRARRLDVVMTISFDGTQTPLATVTENVPEPQQTYRFRVNLRTGAVTHVP